MGHRGLSPLTSNLAGFSFWDWNADPMWGIRNLTITTSTDGTNFSALGGSPTSFAAGANTAPTPVQLFTVTPTAARYLRFNINDTYGMVLLKPSLMETLLVLSLNP